MNLSSGEVSPIGGCIAQRYGNDACG